MDIGLRYVVGHRPATFHTQLDCGRLKGAEEVSREKARLARIVIQDGKHIIPNVGSGVGGVLEKCPACGETLEWRWQDSAACKTAGVDMITPTPSEAEHLIQTYCQGCPVFLDCAAFAVARLQDVTGIWGGIFVPQANGRHKAWRARAKVELRAMVEVESSTEDAA